ncbi:MAG: DUF1801 domain-containing protein [Saprospiraceae bacterium]
MRAIDAFYKEHDEPNQSCLLALKSIILEYNVYISSRWYYRLPCFMYQDQIFCYLWIDKKTQFPYIAIGKGVKIEHPDLIAGKRTFTSILMIDPNKDIPVKTIHSIFDMVMKLYK